MNKVISLALLLLCVLSLNAAPISENQARTVASGFLVSKGFENQKSNLQLVSFGTRSAVPEYFVFNFGQNGFIIIAGDDAAAPVLGYSTESSFSGENMPNSFTAMLESFSVQIAEIRQRGLTADETIQAQWQNYLAENIASEKGISTSQLLTCQWDQGSPYNALCPYDAAGPGNRVYAGCVATAMAMTMYYYRYPTQPTGYHSYNSAYGPLSVDFTQSYYNYEQMPWRLNSANYDAAKLQYDCGVAVDMMYSPNGSGAYMDDALNAMKEHFGYNPAATLEYKGNYTETDWKNLLKAQINAGHPMAYAGYDIDAGHAFVCDGYSDQMFHFNWGWSGSYNGYFFIDNLNPGYNFSAGQQAFINCYPAAVTTPSACGNYHMTARSGSLETGRGLTGYADNQSCSWLIEPADSIQNITIEFRYLNTELNNDTVTIYSGIDESAPIAATYSGNTTPSFLTVNGNKVFITFKSNASVTGSGFHADYYAYTPAFCTILSVHSDSAGTVNDGSHGYPYNNNSVCRWRIEPEGAEGILIEFTEFNLEAQNDFLYFYQYPSYILVDSLSGNALPQSLYINSNKAMVVFKSNDANADAGFTFNYRSLATGLNDYTEASMYVAAENTFPTLHLSHFPAGQYQISLTDLTGRMLYESKHELSATNEKIVIPFTPENSGLYLISLKGNNISRTLKYFSR